ncbi:MAG: hypothetical protein ABIL62_07995 [Planctomycetota bacterium]
MTDSSNTTFYEAVKFAKEEKEQGLEAFRANQSQEKCGRCYLGGPTNE